MRSTMQFRARTLAILLGAVGAAATPGVTHAQPAGNTSAMRPVSVEDLITVRKPSDASISPDGKWVAFVQTTPSLEQNSYLHDLYLVATDGASSPRQLTHNEPRDDLRASFVGLSPTWASKSDRIAYVAKRGDQNRVFLIDVASGQESELVSEKQIGEKVSFAPTYRGQSLAFSPDGTRLAFLAAVTADPPKPKEKILRAIEADEDWTPQGPSREPATQLFIMDLAARTSRAITPAMMNVASFAWSPDGTQLALEAAAYLGIANYMADDIWVVDASGSNEPRALVTLDGWDQKPTWSPDGKRLAFGTQRGAQDWMYTASLAVVDVDGGAPKFIGDTLDKLAGASIAGLRWRPDGRAIDIVSIWKLGSHLFRLNAADGMLQQRLTPREDRYYDSFTWSADGSTMAFIVQGAALPADIFVSPSDRFEPKRLTTLNPEWDRIRVPTVELVTWKSADQKFDVWGLLLKPSNYDPSKTYPMLTGILGGPSMIRQQLNPLWSYPSLVQAEQGGYVVFIPNTRGRSGMGTDFTHAIRDERSYLLGGLGDVLSGVDAMVARKIADPDRLGVHGFSYGGSMTATVISHDTRFKAAIYGEGAPNVIGVLADYPTKHFLTLYRDMWGLGSAFDPDDVKIMFDQSSIFRSQYVRTPTLIETGELSAWKTDRQYYRSLKHFGVAAELWVYPRSGHGWDEPKLMQDAFNRHIRWFDYWILDKPLGDEGKQRVYDAWKALAHRRPERALQGGRRW